jgi:hypothetical protein
MCARHLAILLLFLTTAACSDDGGSAVDAGSDGVDLVNGCPSLTLPQANPGDPIDGDTYATFTAPLVTSFCTRCHSSTRTGDDRNGAPVGLDWDIEATFRAQLTAIRDAVGVRNVMPFNAPFLSCEQRLRLVRWIDAGAP